MPGCTGTRADPDAARPEAVAGGEPGAGCIAGIGGTAVPDGTPGDGNPGDGGIPGDGGTA